MRLVSLFPLFDTNPHNDNQPLSHSRNLNLPLSTADNNVLTFNSVGFDNEQVSN